MGHVPCPWWSWSVLEEIHFFHREAAHCIDVNRALAAFELL